MTASGKVKSSKFFTQKGPTNLTLILVASVLVLALAILGLKLTFFSNSPDQQAPTLTHPAGIVPITYTIDEIKKGYELANKKVDLAGLQIQAFKLKGQTQEQVINFYLAQMKKDGWALGTDENGHFFRKGSQGVLIQAVKEEDASYLDYIEKISPALRKQLEVGDVIITVMYGPYEKLVKLCCV